jgi:hypothetical protein
MPNRIATIVVFNLAGVALIAFQPLVVFACQGLYHSTCDTTKAET